MANYPIPEEPLYNNQMPMLESTDPAHADLFNALYGQLLENCEYLEQELNRKVNTAYVDEKIGDINSILDEINGKVI